MSIFFVHAHTLFGHHHPPSSIWAIFLLLYGPSAIAHLPIFIQQLCFSPNFIDISIFSHMHACDLVTTTQGCHHPTQLIGHPSHPPAGPSATFCPSPINFHQYHIPSVHLT